VDVAEVAPGVMDAGLKDAVAPGGNPVTESATAFAKVPFAAVAVMVNCALLPADAVCALEEPTVKVGVTTAVMLKVPVVEPTWFTSLIVATTEYVPTAVGGVLLPL